ncbi:MAG: hypothetical protein AAFY56_11750 [Pseudomonadota bacterium]
MRAARGIGAKDLARECRIDTEEIEAWLAEDSFQELVDSCRGMMDLPADQRLVELERLALDLLHIALEERDVRVALFFAEQMSRGKNPARVLAETVNRKVTQAAEPLDKPLAPPRSTLKPAADPEAARVRAQFAYYARPWAPAVSAARQRLTDEIVRALRSKAVAPAGDKKPAIGQLPPTPELPFTDRLPKSSTSPIALLGALRTNRPRDGP